MHDEHLLVSPHRGSSSYLPSVPSSDAYLGEDHRVALAKPKFVRQSLVSISSAPTNVSVGDRSLRGLLSQMNDARGYLLFYTNPCQVVNNLRDIFIRGVNDKSLKITENFVIFAKLDTDLSESNLLQTAMHIERAIINISFLFFFTISVKVPVLLAGQRNWR